MAESRIQQNETKTGMFLHGLLCQFCDGPFQEEAQCICVHRTFCRKCLRKYGLHENDLVQNMVCPICIASGITGGNASIYHGTQRQRWDIKQDIFSIMNLLVKARRGLLENSDSPVLSLCEELIQVMNINRSRPIRGDAFNSSSFPDSTQSSIQEGHAAHRHPSESESESESQSESGSKSESESESYDGDPHPHQEPCAVPGTHQQSEHAAIGSSPGSGDASEPTPRSGSSRSSSGGAPPEVSVGTKPCHRGGCQICSIVKDVSFLTSPSTGETVNVEGNFNCDSQYVIYCIECRNCQRRYIGQTTQKLSDRIGQHRRKIENHNQETGPHLYVHFNLPDHTEYTVCVLKRFHPKTSKKNIKKEEKKIMLKLGTIHPHGLNKG